MLDYIPAVFESGNKNDLLYFASCFEATVFIDKDDKIDCFRNKRLLW